MKYLCYISNVPFRIFKPETICSIRTSRAILVAEYKPHFLTRTNAISDEIFMTFLVGNCLAKSRVSVTKLVRFDAKKLLK